MRSIKLHKLLDLVGIIPSSNLIDQEINNISFNSKEVQKGTLFLGMPGLNVMEENFVLRQLKMAQRLPLLGLLQNRKLDLLIEKGFWL